MMEKLSTNHRNESHRLGGPILPFFESKYKSRIFL